jgi:hypothetical protein
MKEIDSRAPQFAATLCREMLATLTRKRTISRGDAQLAATRALHQCKIRVGLSEDALETIHLALRICQTALSQIPDDGLPARVLDL